MGVIASFPSRYGSSPDKAAGRIRDEGATGSRVRCAYPGYGSSETSCLRRAA